MTQKPLNKLKVTRPPKTLRQLAYDKLREAIFNSTFEPGERLIERDLCDQLEVSRTVVREVLRQLEAEGLVETIANQGPIVAILNSDKVKEIYEIRALLEVVAAKACIANGTLEQIDLLSQIVDQIDAAFEEGDSAGVLSQTNRFYEQFFAIARKPFAWEMVQSLNARINRLRVMTISSPDRHEEAIGEMRKIILAIRARDAQAAEQACLEHIQAVATIAGKLLTAT
ncbi:MAG: GntR family transcriptional regulator [Anaerolineae bacterium]